MIRLGVGTPGLIDLRRGSPVHWAVNLDWLDVVERVNGDNVAVLAQELAGLRH